MDITTAMRRRRRTRDPAIMRMPSGLNMFRASLIQEMLHTMDLTTTENVLNRLPNDWSSPQSPDELVIQRRGRRESIIWSPDLDACKQQDLLSLSSRDRTPVKNPSVSDTVLRNKPKRRLSLMDTQSEFSTPEKKMKSSHSLTLPVETNVPEREPNDILANSLRGLSHEQLIQSIMNLVRMQENGELCEGERLRNVLLKNMPIADIQPPIQKLRALRQNIYVSLVSSNLDDYASLHLNAFEEVLIYQGKILQESHHWTSLMRYVLAAWEITKEIEQLSQLENLTEISNRCNMHKCFKILSQLCVEALIRGNFEMTDLEGYIESLEAMAEYCEDFKICLQIAKEAKNRI